MQSHAPKDPAAPRRLDADMLEDYLNQHLLGARPGSASFRAAADTWKDTPQEAQLRALADDVDEDRERLERLIGELGFSVPLAQRAAGAAAEAAGRVNPVNMARTRGSGWTQVELDTLQGALQAKAAMWHVLAGLAPDVPGLDEAEMRALFERAQEQQRAVRRITESTLRERFLRTGA